MTDTVYYWRRRNPFDAGHASLLINKQLFKQLNDQGLMIPVENFRVIDWDDLYVSWVGTKAGVSSRGTSQSFEADKQHFGTWKTKKVVMTGLNRMAMLLEWDRIRQKEGARWKLIDKNCATVVRRVLKAGGGDLHVRDPILRGGIASPASVYAYAKRVAARGGAVNDDE